MTCLMVVMIHAAVRKFEVGFISSVLLWAAANAVSYFALAGGRGNLLGTNPESVVGIGFPWVVWGEGGRFGGYYFSWAGLLADASITLGTGVLVGLTGAWLCGNKLRWPKRQPPADPVFPADRQLQFSLRTLLGTTAAVAFVLSMIRTSAESLAVLLLIVYLFGPSVILVTAQLARRIVPWQRTAILLTTGALLIVMAAVLGESIEGIGDFTKGITGIFVCWIPQCVLILLIVLAWRATEPREK